MGADFYLNPPRPLNESEGHRFRMLAARYCAAVYRGRMSKENLSKLHDQMVRAYVAWGGDKY